MTTGKLLTINQTFGLNEITVAVSVPVVRALGGDWGTAALFCQAWFWSRGGAVEYRRTMPQVEEAIVLSVVKQKRARKILLARGWISERVVRRGGVSILWTRVNPGAVGPALRACLEEWRAQRERAEQPEPNELPCGQVADDETTTGERENAPHDGVGNMPRHGAENAPPLKIRKDPERQEQERLTPGADAPAPAANQQQRARRVGADKPIEADVIAGRWDDHPGAGSVAMCALLCGVICRDWHRGERLIVPGKQRQQLWRDFVAAGGRPSDALKAISGMRHDDWPDRGRSCDLRHVLGKLDVWVRYYEELHLRGATPRWPRAMQRPTPAGFRPWRGLMLPADREPTHGDQLALEAGYVFTFDGREWVDPADDPDGKVRLHRERYGDCNVTPAARARIEASEARRAGG